LSAHFLDEQILTPHTPKKFQTYLYQRKVLMRINSNAESGSPPTEGETVWHEVYCTRCHKEPENRYKPGGGYWLGLPEVTEDEIKRFEGSQEEGQEHEFLVDHYLPEDDGPARGNEDGNEDGSEDAGFQEDIDEDMGTLVDELEDITSSNAGTQAGSQQQRRV
jgi:hypothetical protein